MRFPQSVFLVFLCSLTFHAEAQSKVALTAPRSYSAATNYMSHGGFERWQEYKKTGVWWSGAPYDRYEAKFYIDDYIALGQARHMIEQKFKSNPYARSFSIYGDLEILDLSGTIIFHLVLNTQRFTESVCADCR
jgi:hypothetical protein